jgi:microcystin-dependent protein
MPSTTSKNLGQVAAVIKSATAPSNINVIWIDTSTTPAIKKNWDVNSSTWIPLTQVGTVAGDNWGTQVVQTDSTLQGDGTTASPLKIAQQAATSGQFLKWNGTTWAPANGPAAGLSSVAVTARLSGNGTVGQPLDLGQQSATVGQVLTWNGTNWVPGTPVFNGFVRGMILMWSGDPGQVPTGWNLCDSSNGTPDLRGRFVVSYNPADGDYSNIGDTGGTKTVQLTANQNGQHTHGVNDPGHNHSVSLGTDSKGGSAGVNVLSTQNIKGLYPTNTASAPTGISIQNSGAGDPHENRPPYYVLAYIMKL